MAEETTTTTSKTQLVADEAERARVAAQTAADAAATATAASTIAAGEVATQHEARVARIEEEAGSWRGLREQFETQRQEESSSRTALLQRLDKTEADLALILSRLAPPPEPPPNPNSAPPAGERTPPAAGEAPEPEPPPARKRAHRWT